ncbi:MAG: HNH endonuclease family protein [Actinomycetota bacterium]|nr:HNH endonuclease family protein [Actinomycetota bacterium]
MRSPIALALAGLLASCGIAFVTPAEAATQLSETVLNSLPVSPEHAEGYDRSLFKHWITQYGCTTRQDVIIRQRTAGTVKGCAVADGQWFSDYDGVITSNPRGFDIDHQVPLKEAWDSGAWRWTPDERKAFANDLGYANSLNAVSASSNRSKGEQDPAEWMPPRAGDACRYAKAWVGVKYRWRLAVDTTEKSALVHILRACPARMDLPQLAAL